MGEVKDKMWCKSKKEEGWELGEIKDKESKRVKKNEKIKGESDGA